MTIFVRILAALKVRVTFFFILILHPQTVITLSVVDLNCWSVTTNKSYIIIQGIPRLKNLSAARITPFEGVQSAASVYYISFIEDFLL